MEEHLRVIELAVQVVNHRVKVFAGTGSNSTAEAIYLTQEAKKRGADGFLIVTPYYNKPSQAGLFAHYSALAEATWLPIITYSVPGRTGMEIGVDTMARSPSSTRTSWRSRKRAARSSASASCARRCRTTSRF
jgi:4-hydroxy-tetrahydrodipicolinate synthase